MRLSISSFSDKIALNRSGLGKTTSWFLITILIYVVLVEIFRPKITFFQNQETSNLVGAERFLFNSNSYHSLIVGTSLSARLPHSLLGPGVFNLSLQGGSPLTGLELIRRSHKYPARLLVETNFLYYALDHTFVEYRLNTFSYFTKKYVRALRHEYQPVNLVGNLYLRYFRRDPRFIREHGLENRARNLALANTIDHKDEFPTAPNFQNSIAIFQQLILELESHGIEIIFFEMPVHKLVAAGKRASIVRQSIYRAFAAKRYKYIDFSGLPDLKTTDGLHLDSRSAALVAKKINYYLESMDSSQLAETSQ